MADPTHALILNVDDDEANRYAVTRMLQKARFAVVEATTGREALLKARDRPDLIILDVKLPDASGLDICRRIKTDPETASIPVLHLTANLIQSEDRTRGLESGADGYLVRPVEPPELIATVNALLRARRAERLAREVAQQWQSTFDAIRDGVLLVDAESLVVRCNRGLALMLGLPESAIVGNSARALLRAAEFGPDGCPLAGDFRWDDRWLSIGVNPRLDEEGRPAGCVCVIAEITERKRMEEQLRERAEALIEADHRKDEFLAMLAHELRNPLAPLRNALEIMQPDRGDPSELELARAIAERQVRQMTRLIDDLLDVSRITRGKIELRREPVDLRSIADRALESARPLIEQQAHTLTIAMPPAPLVVDADPTRLEQVLSNLLNNAAKYTKGPGGRIDLSADRVGDEARLVVRDNGSGIPGEVLPHVFDLFTQADRSLDRSQGGLGIGLTMVRNLVDLHGGRVEAESPGPGRGSTFTVYLPLRPAGEGSETLPEPLAPAPETTAGASSPPPRRILIVDDNVDAARILGRLLKLGGHKVQVAHDGPAALMAARTGRPEVVLLDIGLPGMDGFEVASLLRADPDLGPMVIIALTGYGTASDRLRSSREGFDHHLVKPVAIAEVEALIARVGGPV